MNLANQNTTRGLDGKVYRRREVVFEPAQSPGAGAGAAQPAGATGVRVLALREDPGPLPKIHRPGHPHADADGMVTLPNVDTATEMADLMTAGRSFEASVQVIASARQMLAQVLRIGR